MNPGRAQTAFDVALVTVVVVAAVIWGAAMSPGLIGLTALLAVVLLPMLFATVWMLILVSNSLSEKYSYLVVAGVLACNSLIHLWACAAEDGRTTILR